MPPSEAAKTEALLKLEKMRAFKPVFMFGFFALIGVIGSIAIPIGALTNKNDHSLDNWPVISPLLLLGAAVCFFIAKWFYGNYKKVAQKLEEHRKSNR